MSSEWKSMSADELVGTPIKTTAETVAYRLELLKTIALECAQCGDTVDGIFAALKYKRTQLELTTPDASLQILAQKTFDAWWNKPENKVKGTPYDFILGGRNGNDRKGVFPLGEVSAIQGSSGSGKSTLAYKMLLDQRDGEEFFDRPTFGRQFLVVMLDRSEKSLQRTLDSMGISRDELPIYVLSAEQERQDAHEVLADIWSQHRDVQVMFVEGLDLWCRDVNNMATVSQLLSPLQKFAERTHIAIIGSIGAPKAKAGEGYDAPRDRAIGSSAWARKLDTVLDVIEDHKTEERHITLLSRTDKAQKFTAHFSEDGEYVIRSAEPAVTLGIDKAAAQADTGPELARKLFDQGMTKAEIAAQMGVDARTVQRWRNSKR